MLDLEPASWLLPPIASCGTRARFVRPQTDEKIFLGPGRRLRVLDLVPVDEEESTYAGFLKVDSAWANGVPVTLCRCVLSPKRRWRRESARR
jgi:ABC-type oligopeptide transport system substrate-binding subunit